MCKSGNIKHSKYKLHLNDRKIATTFYFNGIKSQHTQYIIMPLQRDIVIICKSKQTNNLEHFWFLEVRKVFNFIYVKHQYVCFIVGDWWLCAKVKMDGWIEM